MDPMDLLPPALRDLSRSATQAVLPYEESLAAIEIFERSRYAVCHWEPCDEPRAEGEIQRRSGEPWADYVHRCAESVRRALHASAMASGRSEAHGGGSTWYRLAVRVPTGSAGIR
ncbi:MAG: hypothetical protein B7Z66_06810 [Chromatiales bacterium 21-64-14]|nr:MAG: hypothetical protein B7Z66_06810 [Chromatiales bacterium 21-64-14]HQU16696.1 hypothetical protein [Gammaproteobacteria bacterium]